ncbi:unnamed protein product [Dovyalis caffra]|uniref:F-box domain-containing protein n=1 Tax=Dovyalis caffra TaxID=77055 RepID=A0AAV1QMM0_9ROSI|nr:unnamed protein product [Dovyalis caffra]
MSCYISNLPNNILEEIFCKLPITTLIQCRFVCKSWKLVLGNPNFTKLQQQLSDTVLCVQEICKSNRYGSREEYTRNIHWLEFKGKSANCNIVPNSSDSFRSRFINSCNGLVCLLVLPSPHIFPGVAFMSIANPVTGESMHLPPLSMGRNLYSYLCGLGFSPKTNRFKAVRIFPDGLDFQAEVCTIGASYWRSIEVTLPRYDYFTEENRELRVKSVVFANGSLHWLIKRIELHSIEFCVFDFDAEQFRQMAGPPPLQQGFENRYRVGTCTYKDTLCVWESRNFLEIWQMKEYGVPESWAKVLVIKERFASLEPFVSLKNGDIVVFGWQGLWLYDPEKEMFTRLDSPENPFEKKTIRIKTSIVEGANGYDAVIKYENRWFVHKPSFVSLKNMVSQDN